MVGSENVSAGSGEEIILDETIQKLPSLKRQNTSTPVMNRINTIEEEEDEKEIAGISAKEMLNNEIKNRWIDYVKEKINKFQEEKNDKSQHLPIRTQRTEHAMYSVLPHSYSSIRDMELK